LDRPNIGKNHMLTDCCCLYASEHKIDMARCQRLGLVLASKANCWMCWG